MKNYNKHAYRVSQNFMHKLGGDVVNIVKKAWAEKSSSPDKGHSKSTVEKAEENALLYNK